MGIEQILNSASVVYLVTSLQSIPRAGNNSPASMPQLFQQGHTEPMVKHFLFSSVQPYSATQELHTIGHHYHQSNAHSPTTAQQTPSQSVIKNQRVLFWKGTPQKHETWWSIPGTLHRAALMSLLPQKIFQIPSPYTFGE